MGQTVDNGLQFINVNERYKKGQEMFSGSDFGVEKNKGIDLDGAMSKEELIGYKYEKGNAQIGNTTVDNFEEYLRNKQEKAKEAGEDERSKEQKAKEDAKEISRSLSSEEIKKLKMMGIDVSSAKLSDLMGMVNTMRGQAHREELAQMLADISVEKGDVEGLSLVGGTAKVAGMDVEVSTVDVTDVILAKENETDNSIDFTLSNDELVYIIKNQLNLTKENMYKAHFSGSVSGKETMPEDVLKQMMPQIEKVMEQAGIDKDQVALDGARFLMDNNLPMTTDNLKTYVEYQKLSGLDVSQVAFEHVDQSSINKKAENIVKDVASFKPAMVLDMVQNKKEITIASMKKYKEEYKDYSQAISDKDLKEVVALRQLEELRLSMTMEAAVKLVKADFNIETRELSKVVSRLKNIEELMIKNQLKEAYVELTKENIELYQELNEKVSKLGNSHAKLLASPLRGIEFSVNALHNESQVMEQPIDTPDYETVKRKLAVNSYEAVGTAPRRDMGDSITKAFANVPDILKEMNLPVNYENERAVRILGYNSIEITPDNISQVVNYDRQVNQLIDTFYPEAVLSMIKDGINPLDVPIDELNQIISQHNYNAGVSEAENFATYLRDMEKQGMVSPEERESYIGIYRVMEKLSKSGDREAGWIFNNKAELTVRNLISAMRSRKASGIDINIDQNFGLLEEMVLSGKDMEKQIDSAFGLERDVVEEEKEYLSKISEASKEIMDFLVDNNIEITGINVLAAEKMLESQGGIYQLVSELLSKMKFKTNLKDELIDEETENFKDSMSEEEIYLPFAPESILESLRGSEEMSLKYDDLRDRLTELMYNAGAMGTITSMDISAIKTVSAGFNVMSNMAKNHRYQLPVETNEGIRIMNLTIERDETNQGTIDIFMKNEETGDITARVKVDSNKNIYGYVVSSTMEGNYILQSMKESFENQLRGYNFRSEGVKLGIVSGLDDSGDMGTGTTDTLYEASLALVKAISGFFG